MVNRRENGRSSSLDLSRFLAALIVFLGHLLWFDQRFENLQKNSLLELIRTGDQSVLYFFTLSGFVLSMTTSRIDLRWLIARFVRLMPVYLICFIVPLISIKIMAPEEFDVYPTIGIWFGLFGIQSLIAKYYLAGANSPLWSLSVEFMLSFALVLLTKLKTVKTKVILILACEIINYFFFQPVINGLSFFIIGIILHQLKGRKLLTRTESRAWIYFSGSVVIIYWILFPIIGLSLVAPRIVDITGVTFTLICFDQIRLNSKIENICEFLGKRTYSLYAVHSPIIRFHSETFEKFCSGNSQLNNNIFFLSTSILLVACFTEVIFQLVEKPSVKYAKKIRNPLKA